MKKKTKILLIVGVILVVCSYFGYKAFNLLVRYNIDNKSDVIDSLKINDSKFIQFQQNLKDNQEYLEFKNIKVRNDFKDFRFLDDVSTDDDLKFRLDDENDNRKAAIMIGVAPTYVEYLKSDIDVFSDDGANITNDDLDNIKEFLKENGINNDVNLFKYIIEHKDDKNSIFASTKELRNNYIIYYLMHIMLPHNSGVTLIDGTYSGYIFELDNGVKEVNILYYDKRYIFTFIGDDYFNDEYIYDFLGTLIIESSTDESGKVVFTDDDTFTRTYNIIDVIENNSLEYDSFEIKQYQNEKSYIVDVKKDLAKNIEKNKNYEFTFKINKDVIIEDEIKAIFDNYEIVDVVETDKVGLEQTQETPYLWRKVG